LVARRRLPRRRASAVVLAHQGEGSRC
jgi:hypothetical protein